ncbi:unnamed protein product [Scytosiphon promiscuus]
MKSTMLKVALIALFQQGAMAAPVDGILEQHNAYRCMHSAPALTYSTDLEADAQVWADHLATNKCGILEHDSDRSGQGENLAICSGIPQASADCASGFTATVNWYNEVEFYVEGPSGGTSDPTEQVGHFTQVVWKNTEQVGCASSTCESPYTGDSSFFQGQNWKRTYVACRYSPAGNFQTQYLEQVQAVATEGTSVDDCEACVEDGDCSIPGEECCSNGNVCRLKSDDPGACGDPHMTGFRGQKFDFNGEDGAWYSVISSEPSVHLNMRVTSPVPSLPEITYITGVSLLTTDQDGLDHTIVIQVADPHSLESSCPVGISPCLGEGALSVEIDGVEALLTPGTVTLGPGVALSAINVPGACRSFGFEKYWERKKAEYAQAGGRRLTNDGMTLQSMAEWIVADPTVTNMDECTEYVAWATAEGRDEDGDLFAHDSEHVSIQIVTPAGRIRLTHGKLHQLPMRDPTNQHDLPDHLTWQMNLAIDEHSIDAGATGILGETLVPTLDEYGEPIMEGMLAIPGVEEDYRVDGPLGVLSA